MRIEYRIFQITHYTEGFKIEALPEHPDDAKKKSTQGELFAKELAEFLHAMGSGGWQIQAPIVIPGMEYRGDGHFMIFTRPETT